jgi:hypothetical protein
MRQRSERVCDELRQFGSAQLLSVLAAVHMASHSGCRRDEI